MPEETRPEPLLPAAYEPREPAAQTAKEVTPEQIRRRAREAPPRARARPRGAPIAGPPQMIAERLEQQSGGIPTLVAASRSVSSGRAEIEKRIAEAIAEHVEQQIAEQAQEHSGDPTPVRPSAGILSAPAEDAKLVAKETGGFTGIGDQLGDPSEATAEQSAQRKKAIATEIVSAASSHSPEAAGKEAAAVREPTREETLYDAVGSPEALPEDSEEMRQTVADQISSPVPIVRWTYVSPRLSAEILRAVTAENRRLSRLASGEAIADEAQTSTERPEPSEIDRAVVRATGSRPRMRPVLARWRDTLRQGARRVFHLLTQAATWRRVGKAVLAYLARFVPGSEGAILRRSREIRELFRDLHEEPKKPGTWTNCPK